MMLCARDLRCDVTPACVGLRKSHLFISRATHVHSPHQASHRAAKRCSSFLGPACRLRACLPGRRMPSLMPPTRRWVSALVCVTLCSLCGAGSLVVGQDVLSADATGSELLAGLASDGAGFDAGDDDVDVAAWRRLTVNDVDEGDAGGGSGAAHMSPRYAEGLARIRGNLLRLREALDSPGPHNNATGLERAAFALARKLPGRKAPGESEFVPRRPRAAAAAAGVARGRAHAAQSPPPADIDGGAAAAPSAMLSAVGRSPRLRGGRGRHANNDTVVVRADVAATSLLHDAAVAVDLSAAARPYGGDCCYDYPALDPASHPRHRPGLCYVSDRFKFVYLLVPKAGSSTSRSLAQRYGGRTTTYDRLTKAQREYFTFTFVRDPVSRLESAYTTMLNRAKGDCEKYERFADDDGGGAKQLCHDMYHAPDGFQLFIRFLAEHGAGFDEHVRPQVSFFNTAARGSGGGPKRDKFVRPDLVANIKDIGRVWPLVSRKLGFDPPLLSVPRMRQREGGHIVAQRKINLTLTPESLELAEGVYTNDYCCFFPGRLEAGQEAEAAQEETAWLLEGKEAA